MQQTLNEIISGLKIIMRVMKVQRYKLVIEYLGSGFVGWQKQKNCISVQEVIENAIYSFTNEKVALYAAGRTDAGVHAKGQVAHVAFEKETDNIRFIKAINHFVRPHKVSIISCEQVEDSFHARFSATKRHYEYIILNRGSPSAIDENRIWHVYAPLDLSKMREAALFLVGHHDFSSFRAKECQAHSPMKTLDKLNILKEGDYIKFQLSALSFLHHMVRNIVGTLKLVGEGKMSPQYVKHILDAKNRSVAGVTAPADGLYFMKVDYP